MDTREDAGMTVGSDVRSSRLTAEVTTPVGPLAFGSPRAAGAVTDTADAPVWALLGTHLGDNRTIEALAEAVGLPWRRVALGFNPLGGLPNQLPRGSTFTLKRGFRAKLAPPWPKIVITSGKRAVPIALAIRAASAGRTRLVHLGRPQAPLRLFDLVITSPQYGLPDRQNVLTLCFPPIAPPPLDAGLAPDLAVLPRPRLVAIVGGATPPLALDEGVARAFAAEAVARAKAAGGSLLVATSPRTSARAAAALRQALESADAPIVLSMFGEGPNRYRDFLACADRFLVTDETVSMVAEAAFTGAPVDLFRLPLRPSPTWRVVRATQAAVTRTQAGRRFMATLVGLGLVRSNRDLDAYMRALEADGLLSGGTAARELAAAELGTAARRVRRLASD